MSPADLSEKSNNLRTSDEARLATFFARPEWVSVRPILEQIAPGSVEPIEAVIQRVRRETWKDLS